MQNPQINSDLLFWNNIKERLPMDDQEQKFPDRNRVRICGLRSQNGQKVKIRFKNIKAVMPKNYTQHQLFRFQTILKKINFS